MVLGCEGRFGIISEVKVRVSALPADERFYGVFLPSWSKALQAIQQLAQARVPLSMLRLSNAVETERSLALLQTRIRGYCPDARAVVAKG